MTYISLGLWMLTVIVVGVLSLTRLRAIDKADHAKCIAHIASVSSNRTVAEVLRGLAERYDDVEGRAEVAALADASARLTFAESVSIPAAWLRLHADKIDPPKEWDFNEVAL